MKTLVIVEKDMSERGNHFDLSVVGDFTGKYLSSGEPLQVGDVLTREGNTDKYIVVKHKSNGYSVMGDCMGTKNTDVLDRRYHIFKKCYNLKEGDSDFYFGKVECFLTPKRTITIDGKKIEISEESFQAFKKQFQE